MKLWNIFTSLIAMILFPIGFPLYHLGLKQQNISVGFKNDWKEYWEFSIEGILNSDKQLDNIKGE